MPEDRVKFIPDGEDYRIQIDGKDYGRIEKTKAEDYLADAAKLDHDEFVAAIKEEPWVRKFGNSRS